MSAPVIVVAPLAAAAYPDGHYRLKRACRTHAVRLVDGVPAAVLCETVKLESVLDDETKYFSAFEVLPSCVVCARRVERIRCLRDALKKEHERAGGKLYQ